MGLSQDHYQTLHTEFGNTIANFILLALSVGFSVLGARGAKPGRAALTQ